MNTLVGAYAIEAEIGRGGMGRVYRARHLPTGALRAIKMLDGSPDVDAVARFRREAEGLARIQPGDSVPIHETGKEDGGRLYFVMDLMPGGSLRDRLKGRGALPWQEAARLVARLAQAMGRAHDLGLVHRDLKPENILFDEQGEPRIADWGCVRDLAAATLTATGTAVGTPRYMAPEQLDGKRVGAPADIYALGVILEEAVTGAAPFEGQGWVAILAAIRAGRRARCARVAGVPAALDAVLDRALAFEPGDRHARAFDLAADLEALVSGKAVAPAPRSRGVSTRVAVIVLAAVLSLGLVGLLVRSRGTDHANPPAPVAPPPVPPERTDEVEAAIVGAAPITSAELTLVASALPGREVSIATLVFQHPAKLLEPFRAARGETPALGRLFFVAAIASGRVDLRDEALAAWKDAGGRAEPGKLLANAIGNVDTFVKRLDSLPTDAQSPAGELEAHRVRAALEVLAAADHALATPAALAVILDPLRPIARGALREHLFQAATPREARLSDIAKALEKVPPETLPPVLEAVDTIRVRAGDHGSALTVSMRRAERLLRQLDDEPELFSAVACWLADANSALFRWQEPHDRALLDAGLRALDRRRGGHVESADPLWARFMERERHHWTAMLEDFASVGGPPAQRAEHSARAEAEARSALAVTESQVDGLNAVPQRAREDARYVVEILLGAGRMQDVDDALRSRLSGDDPLKAELMRVKDQDPAGALRYASGLLGRKMDGADAKNTHAVCALASADLGDFAGARREVDAMRAIEGSVQADWLGARDIDAYIAAKETAAKGK